MIPEYNRKSLGFGITGIVLQVLPFPALVIASAVGHDPYDPDAVNTLGLVIGSLPFVGTLLLFVGLAYYAKAKGRHPAWCLLALLSCFGFMLLAFLKDKVPHGDPRLLPPTQ